MLHMAGRQLNNLLIDRRKLLTSIVAALFVRIVGVHLTYLWVYQLKHPKTKTSLSMWRNGSCLKRILFILCRGLNFKFSERHLEYIAQSFIACSESNPGQLVRMRTSALCLLIYVTLTKDALETSIFLSRVPVLKHQTIRLGVPVCRPVLELKFNWQLYLEYCLNWHFYINFYGWLQSKRYFL